MSNFLREFLNEILQYIVLESKKKEGFCPLFLLKGYSEIVT